MNLHRTTGKPDWEAIKPSKRNVFQKVAAATHSIVTPPNIITVIGLAIVIYGLIEIINQNFWVGVSALVVGRLLDIVDGAVAEATHTKSPTGEIFDAAADKIGTILTIVALFAANVANWWVIALLLIPQAIIPLVSFYKRRKGIQVHPTRQGKLSMAALWAAIAGLLLTKALGDPAVLAAFTYVFIVIAVVLGFYALWQYATDRD